MKIVPKPLRVEYAEGIFVFNKKTKVDVEEYIYSELFFLDFDEVVENSVEINISDIEFDYIIEIADKIKITLKDEKQLFYSVQSLKQLIFEYYNDGKSEIPYMTIKDKAKMEYRGYMLDISRHFFGLDVIKQVVDCISLAKINKLHLHLSDDQGFRVESKIYPKLNEIGSVRKETYGDGEEHRGYLKQDEIKELVKYCDKRGVEVIPEIDLPGHTVSIIASYPELSCFNTKVETATWAGINYYVLCLANEKVYEFISNLLKEILDLFPSKYVHLGGDEAPSYSWSLCPKCQELYKKSGVKSYYEYQLLFTNKVAEIVKGLGKVPIMWNEAFLGGMNKEVVMQYWSEDFRKKVGAKHTANGQKTIISRRTSHYLDYPHYPTSMKKVYKYNPKRDGFKSMDNILGFEAPLWSEFVTNTNKLFKNTFPRVFALSEATWSENKNYSDFKNRLCNLLGIMEAYEYPYEELKNVDSKSISNIHKVTKFGMGFAKAANLKEKENQKKKISEVSKSNGLDGQKQEK